MSRYIDAEKILPYISRLLGGMPYAILKMAEIDGIDLVRCNDCKIKEDCPLRLIANLEYCSIGEKE